MTTRAFSNFKVFVENFPSLDSKDLQALVDRFRRYGEVVGRTLRSGFNSNLRQLSEQNKDCLLLKFRSRESTFRAAESENGAIFMGFPLKVSTRLRVKIEDIPPGIPVDVLENKFWQYGKIVKFDSSEAEKGICYVTFMSPEDSGLAIQKEDNSESFGWKVSFSDDGGNHQREKAGDFKEEAMTNQFVYRRKLHIKGLHEGFNPDDLLKRFAQHGVIVNTTARIMSKNRRFCFIEFATEEQAGKAIAHENNTRFEKARIMVKEANFHCMHGNNEVIDFEVVKPLDYFIGFATEKDKSDEDPSKHQDYLDKNKYSNPSENPKSPEPRTVEIMCKLRSLKPYAEKLIDKLVDIGVKNVDIMMIRPACDLSKLTMKMKESGVLYAIILIHADDKNRLASVKDLRNWRGLNSVPNNQVINFIKDGLDADKKNKLVLPRDVRTIAEMMREERPMSVMEYDKMIRFMVNYRSSKMRETYGLNIPAHLLEPPIYLHKNPVLKAAEYSVQKCLLEALIKLPAALPPDPEPSAPLLNLVDTKHSSSYSRQDSHRKSDSYSSVTTVRGGRNHRRSDDRTDKRDPGQSAKRSAMPSDISSTLRSLSAAEKDYQLEVKSKLAEQDHLLQEEKELKIQMVQSTSDISSGANHSLSDAELHQYELIVQNKLAEQQRQLQEKELNNQIVPNTSNISSGASHFLSAAEQDYQLIVKSKLAEQDRLHQEEQELINQMTSPQIIIIE